MDGLWTHCLRHFEKELPPQQFRTWIQPLQASAHGKILTITAPNRFVLQWVKDRFLPVIEQLAHEVAPDQVSVVLQLAEPGAAAADKADTTPAPVADTPKPKVKDQSRLNPAFTFDSFVTGKANQLARAAAL